MFLSKYAFLIAVLIFFISYVNHLICSIDRTKPVKSESIDNELYEIANWWGNNSPYRILRNMNRVRIPFFVEKFKNSGNKILDIGCGGGLVSEELAMNGFSVTGIDRSINSLEIASNHWRATDNDMVAPKYILGDAYKLPFDSESFDGVVISDVLEHLDDLKKVVNEIHRVLKPKGVLVFDTINRSIFSVLAIWALAQEIFGLLPPKAHDWQLFIQEHELESILNSQGFKTNLQEWRGINPNWFNLLDILNYGIYDGMSFVESIDLSGSYMGSAVKN